MVALRYNGGFAGAKQEFDPDLTAKFFAQNINLLVKVTPGHQDNGSRQA